MESNQCSCSPLCHPAASSHYCTVCEARNQRITQRGRIGVLVVTHAGVALRSCCRTPRRGLVGSDHCFSRNHFRNLNAGITIGLEPYRQAVLSTSKPGYAHRFRNAAGLEVAFGPISLHCYRQDATRQHNAYTPSPAQTPITHAHKLQRKLLITYSRQSLFDEN